jgi:hypothetical protein
MTITASVMLQKKVFHLMSSQLMGYREWCLVVLILWCFYFFVGGGSIFASGAGKLLDRKVLVSTVVQIRQLRKTPVEGVSKKVFPILMQQV